MPEYYRRTIEELIARYDLEPSLRDVFVEGWFDTRVIRWLSQELGADSAALYEVAVYEIDTIEIGPDSLAQADLSDSTRSRVIWLALRLSRDLGQDSLSVTCVADSDFDVALDRSMKCGLLLYTDLAGMEMYFFERGLLTKALTVGAGVSADVDSLLSIIRPVLERMFLIRCANVALGWGMEWYEPWECTEYRDDRVFFDEKEFVDRYLNKNARFRNRVEFLEKVDEVLGRCGESVPIRGHDAFEMLAWVLQKTGVRREFCEHNVLLALALAGATMTDLMRWPLFQKLRVRLRGA